MTYEIEETRLREQIIIISPIQSLGVVRSAFLTGLTGILWTLRLAANLRRVFEFIQTGQWVVLFDEFDAIGKDRDNPFEHGELKRVVNTLLQLMDAFRGESLLIAATNHETLLDKGVWRRFEAVVQFPVPTPQDRVLLLRQFLRGFDTTALNLESLAGKLDGATGATSRGFALRPRGWRCSKAETRSAVKMYRRL
jgi:ATPase family associated with various cellular activities (AAA)